MTDNSDRWGEIDVLLDRVLDGIETTEDVRRLNEILRTDPQAWRRFVSYMALHGRLVSGEGLAAGRAAGPMTEADCGRLGDASGAESPAMQAIDASPQADGRLPDERPAAAAAPLAVHPALTTGAFGFLSGAALYYAVAALCLCVGVLAAWTWGLNNAASHPNPDAPAVGAASPGQVATVSGMVDCQWGKGGTGLASGAALAAGAPISAGRRIVLESGLLEIVYRHRGEVILRGPVDYTVDSAGGGFLASGQATVRLVKLRDAATGKAVSLRPAFTIRTPASLVTNLGAESGAELAQSTEFGVAVEGRRSRICVFRGKVAVELLDGQRSLPAIPVDAGRVAVAERSSPARQGMISIDHSPSDYRQFAHRVLVPSDGGERQVAWLKAIGTGWQRQLIAVGTGEDIELPAGDGSPLDDGSQAAGGTGLISGTRAVATYTCRLSFDLGTLSPNTAMLQLLYVARNRIAAVRLNGKPLPGVPPAGANRGPQEIGQFNIRGGLGHDAFVRGINTLDIDVDDVVGANAPPVLWIRQEVSGIWAPPPGGCAPAATGQKER